MSAAKQLASPTAAALPGRTLVPPPTILLFATRERARTLMRAAFPRRRARLVLARTPDELESAFRVALVDAAVIDLAGAHEDTWRAAALAREFSSVPFFGLTSLRAAESPALAQCAALDFADVLVESVDDDVARGLVMRHAFSTRFSAALAIRQPPSDSTRRSSALRGAALSRGPAARCARRCSLTPSGSRASTSAGRSPHPAHQTSSA